MIKRVIAAAATVALCIMAVSCGEPGDPSQGQSKGKAVGEGYKVGIVVDDTGIDDGSFNQLAWTGAQRAAKQLGVTVNYHEQQKGGDNLENIESFIREKYDLVICVGFTIAEDLRKAAVDNPKFRFAIVDDASDSDLENVTCLMFEQSESAYLAGYVSGLTSRTMTIGIVLGETTALMNEFGYGYLAGALDANPEITVLQKNIDSFSDQDAGRAAAQEMVASGADIVFHAAGGAGLGVIDACKQARIWAVGVDSDQSVIAPETVLTSAMKRVDVAVYDTIESAVNDSLSGGVKIYSLRDAGVDIAPTTDNMDAIVLDKVNKAKEKIIEGGIRVPKNKMDFESRYGNVYELD